MHVRERPKQTHICITPCCLYSSSVVLMMDFRAAFLIPPYPDKGLKGAGFSLTEALNTS